MDFLRVLVVLAWRLAGYLALSIFAVFKHSAENMSIILRLLSKPSSIISRLLMIGSTLLGGSIPSPSVVTF